MLIFTVLWNLKFDKEIFKTRWYICMFYTHILIWYLFRKFLYWVKWTRSCDHMTCVLTVPSMNFFRKWGHWYLFKVHPPVWWTIESVNQLYSKHTHVLVCLSLWSSKTGTNLKHLHFDWMLMIAQAFCGWKFVNELETLFGTPYLYIVVLHKHQSCCWIKGEILSSYQLSNELVLVEKAFICT